MHRKLLLSVSAFILLLVILCDNYFNELLFRFPSGIHEWGQADRLALAFNFYDNGMNLFLPSTYSQYSVNGITGVEFPVQSYLAAAIARINGRQYISINFRLLDTLISCCGLLALFLTGFRATRDFIYSLVAPVFIFCAPVFVFYTCNYLPDTASSSLVFIAFYFLFDYLPEKKLRPLFIALVFLTLATLIKTSSGIYLTGVTGFAILQFIKRRDKQSLRGILSFVSVTVVCILAVVAYYFYNQYLNEKYHSTLFLSKIQPFRDMQEFRDYQNKYFKVQWIKEYLAYPEYLFFPMLFAASLTFLRRDQPARMRFYLFLIFLAGALLMAYLVGHQLLLHDYYVICIFFPLLAFGLLTAMISIAREADSSVSAKRALRTALATGMLFIIFFGNFQVSQRISPDYQPHSQWYRSPWMEGGAKTLERLGIPRQEKLLVLNEYAPNLGLTYFDRKGYHLFPETWDGDIRIVEQFMKEHHVRYMVMESSGANELMQINPGIFSSFRILSNDRAAVLEIKDPH